MPARPVPVQWEVAEDEGFRRVVRRGIKLADPGLTHSVHMAEEDLDLVVHLGDYIYPHADAGCVHRRGRSPRRPAGVRAAPAMVIGLAGARSRCNAARCRPNHLSSAPTTFVAVAGKRQEHDDDRDY